MLVLLSCICISIFLFVLLHAGPVAPVVWLFCFFCFLGVFLDFLTDVLDLQCLCVSGERQSSLMHKQIIPQPHGGCNMIRIFIVVRRLSLILSSANHRQGCAREGKIGEQCKKKPTTATETISHEMSLNEHV